MAVWFLWNTDPQLTKPSNLGLKYISPWYLCVLPFRGPSVVKTANTKTANIEADMFSKKALEIPNPFFKMFLKFLKTYMAANLK